MLVAVVVFPNGGLCFPSFSSFTKSTLGNSKFSQKDGASLFASRRDLLQSTVWSIRSEGNRRGRPPRRNTTSCRTTKDDNNQKIPQTSDDESSDSSNQDEIIALFRRIQSSISKSGSGSTKKRSSDNSKEKQSAESVLDVLRQSRKQAKDKISNQEKDKVLPARRGIRKKEQRTEDSSPRVDVKLTRPPSNFLKRSPIPTLSAPKGKVVEVIREGSPAAIGGKELELQRVEQMKLPELKELAKSRGIKGYSKLKKGELMELLKGLLSS